MTEVRYRRGECEEALQMADDFLVTVEAGSPHYTAYQVYAIRAEIRLARGDQPGAISDAENALALGREIADPQALFYALPACAHVFSLSSGSDRAVPLARELLAALGRGENMQFAVITLPAFASTAFRLDLVQELVDALADRRASPWMEVVKAYARRDLVTAAEIIQQIGSRPDEAEARLRASEQLVAEGRRPEADEQLRRALELYQAMGATHYVRECEALLAASA